MNPKASCGVHILRCATLSELEFHNKLKKRQERFHTKFGMTLLPSPEFVKHFLKAKHAGYR
jgi:hypothetical protein